jgi:hypothetical protein
LYQHGNNAVAQSSQLSVRAERGNAISSENPSFIAGAAGSGGLALGAPKDCKSAICGFSRRDFVSVPIGNLVKTGGSQARLFRTTVRLDPVDCIVASGTISAGKLYGIESGVTRPAGGSRRSAAPAERH